MNPPPHRVWRIVHSEASLGWGGQERRVMAELLGFCGRRHAVGVIAPVRATIFSEAAQHDLPRLALAEPRWAFPYAVLRTARWLRAFRAEVVNTHSSRDGWVVGLAARVARTPVLIRSRHIDVDYPHRWLSRHAFTTLADEVLTTSDKITNHLRTRFTLPAERVTTVSTGIDLERFHPGATPAVLPGPAGEAQWPTVGMVSVLRSWKGHATFCAAARRLRAEGRKIRFIVVGGGAPVAHFQALAQAEGAEDCVSFIGHREDVPEVLRSLSVLVIPSTRHEGIPQIGLQALACETPVVGSDCGGIPEVIRPGKTGRVFPAGDDAALATCLAEALDHPEETRQLAGAGRRFAESAHGLDAMLDRLEMIYRRHLG